MGRVQRARPEPGVALRSQQTGAPVWAVDPANAGPDRPPRGRSLFDLVVSGRIPFPVERLVDRIETAAGCAPRVAACTRKALIPLGRSLQRMASAGLGFFAYPRLLVAVDREPSAMRRGRPTRALRLKDRLFLAYHEPAALLEVISYNEDAGRFEFQIVRDYRAQGARELVYASRTICKTCHQNLAPLFSRPQWDETQANPQIAARLAAARDSFYGVAPRAASGEPNAFDDATDRANRLAVAQRLWWEGCGERAVGATRCRAAALLAALEYRRSGERGFDSGGSFRQAVVAAVARNAASRWPAGLAIPNPDIPNRDPLAHAELATGPAIAHVDAALEAISPRAPAEIWQPDGPLLARRLVLGIGEQFSSADLRALQASLARRTARRAPSSAPRDDGSALSDAVAGLLAQSDGSAIDALATPVFDRTRVLAALALQLGEPPPVAWSGSEADLPAPAIDTERALAAESPPAAKPFQRACGACHGSPERSPANFLHGAPTRVEAALTSCAPRMLVRLAMWDRPRERRTKTPMPPPLALFPNDAGGDHAAPSRTLLQTLRTAAGRLLQAETGRVPEIEGLLARGYENLRPCLPEGW